jgi:S-DNA-T family DNA segregation ATPase FtsK/SpoIIIE
VTSLPPHSGEREPAQGDWLNHAARLQLHFGRYVRDAAGVACLTVALLGLLASLGWTGGTVLSPASAFFSTWLGWGRFLLVAGFVYVGIGLVGRGSLQLNWSRVLLIELCALLTLGILAKMGGDSLVRGDAGMDGGRLGWGISYLASRYLGRAWGAVMLVALWLLSLATGVGAWSWLNRRLLSMAGDAPAQGTVRAGLPPSDTASAPEASPIQSKKRGAKRELEQHMPRSLVERQGHGRAVKAPTRAASLPSLNILQAEQTAEADERTINQTAGLITRTLSEFGIPAAVIGYRVGPAITQFAVQPGFIKKPGVAEDEEAQQMKVRVAQIANLQKDLALALSAERLRIEAPVPGKPYVGLEVPNARSAIVKLKPILESEVFRASQAPLSVALGRDVSGNPVIADLARMPHLLIAGATGSGKSVCITALAACLALNNSPETLRLIMIDSKMVELLRFNGLRHLYGRVETNIDRIEGVLRWVVLEMEHRYRLLEDARARDLDGFNRKQMRKTGSHQLPRIVVLVDELADLMMSAPDQTEHNLVRLAQMARATGIHLVVATQRPSTDVVTGVIKANFPARLAFAVTSSVDSRVILDASGAETLLGRGDMLFLNPEVGAPLRAQGVLVSDVEIERIIEYWQERTGPSSEEPVPWEKLLQEPDQDQDDDLVEQAISLVRSGGRASASLLQRRLRIGYPRAARLLDQLEEAGVVGPSQGGGKEREVLPVDQDFSAGG